MLRSLLLVAAIACSRADFTVQFDVITTDGPGSFQVLVHEDWAPIGANRFRDLVEEKFYDDTRFFRVIPSFMVQFGLSGDPAKSAEWRSLTINDEPVKESNKPGYITFAKTGAPNSRTTQLFINYVDNARLDGMGFAPFGEVVGKGMDVVRKIYNCGEKPNQGQMCIRDRSWRDPGSSCRGTSCPRSGSDAGWASRRSCRSSARRPCPCRRPLRTARSPCRRAARCRRS